MGTPEGRPPEHGEERLHGENRLGNPVEGKDEIGLEGTVSEISSTNRKVSLCRG